MTTLAGAVAAPLAAPRRRFLSAAALIMFGLADILVFGLFAPEGDASFVLSLPNAAVHVPTVQIAAAPAAYVLGAASIAIGILRALVDLGTRAKRWSIALVLVFFVLALLCWADAGKIPLSLVNLLQSTVARSIPLVLGALAGCLCERSGVINIAIEGQLLLGAFGAAMIASVTGVLWFGLIAGSVAGGLIALMLDVFAAGLTGYLYDRALVPYQNTLNAPSTFSAVKVPLLGDIPIIGPIFFDSSIFLYITYAILILVQVGLFQTRWGLRVRAVGEHPTAADTVGIRVLATRYRNVILGGLVAGIGGAYLTIGVVGAFGKGISSGKGYIALAAMIFGRWTPFGAVGAALIFGFADALQGILSTLNVPVSSEILLMAPYVATIVAVAGLVGRVRAPAADGKPYVKS